MIILNFKIYFTIFILYMIINNFNKCIEIFAISGVNATGTRPIQTNLYLDTETNVLEIWDPSLLINTHLSLNLSFIVFFLLIHVNHRLYSQNIIKSIRSCRIIKTRYSTRCKGSNARNSKSKKNFKKLVSKLILISLFKCLLMAIIFLAIKHKQSPN